MDKVFTIIIKAKLTITQFLCNVIILSVTRLRPSHSLSHTHTCTHTQLKAAGAFASQTPSLRLLLSPQGTQAKRSPCPGPPVPLTQVLHLSSGAGGQIPGRRRVSTLDSPVCSAGPRASGLVPRGQAGRRGWGVALRWVWLHQSTNAILVWRGEKGPAWSACAGPGGSSPQASQGSRSRLTMASLGPKETAWAWEMWGLKSFKGKTLGPEARRN